MVSVSALRLAGQAVNARLILARDVVSVCLKIKRGLIIFCRVVSSRAPTHTMS